MSNLMKFMMVIIAFAFLLFLNAGILPDTAVQGKEKRDHFVPKRIAV